MEAVKALVRIQMTRKGLLKGAKNKTCIALQ